MTWGGGSAIYARSELSFVLLGGQISLRHCKFVLDFHLNSFSIWIRPYFNLENGGSLWCVCYDQALCAWGRPPLLYWYYVSRLVTMLLLKKTKDPVFPTALIVKTALSTKGIKSLAQDETPGCMSGEQTLNHGIVRCAFFSVCFSRAHLLRSLGNKLILHNYVWW
jgi:hypothetical protein